MRSGTKASTRNSARPIGGRRVGAQFDVQVPAAAPADSTTGRYTEASAARGGVARRNTCPFGRRTVICAGRLDRLPGGVAQHRHHLHRLAGPVDAAVEPDEGVERSRIRLALHAAIGQVERSGVQVQRGEVVVGAERLQRGRRQRPLALQQRGGKPSHAVGIGARLGQDIVVARQQHHLNVRLRLARRYSHAPARSDRRSRATPWGRDRCAGSPAPQRHRWRRAVARGGHQRVQPRPRSGQRRRGAAARYARRVGLPFRRCRPCPPTPRGRTFPPDCSAAQLSTGSPSVPSRSRLAILRSVRRISFSDTADRLTVVSVDRRRLPARQHEHPRVEGDAAAGGSASLPPAWSPSPGSGRPRPAFRRAG